jgi:hypothetical protein
MKNMLNLTILPYWIKKKDAATMALRSPLDHELSKKRAHVSLFAISSFFLLLISSNRWCNTNGLCGRYDVVYG